MFKLGDTVTAEQFYKFAPFGLELICHKYRGCDCDYAEDYDECCCGSGEYDIILRHSLSEFPPLTSTANIQGYEIHFTAGLVPKPGYIWDSEEHEIERLCSWSSLPNDFVVHKLPTISLLKRKQL